jgi:hypothetical protein
MGVDLVKRDLRFKAAYPYPVEMVHIAFAVREAEAWLL